MGVKKGNAFNYYLLNVFITRVCVRVIPTCCGNKVLLAVGWPPV